MLKRLGRSKPAQWLVSVVAVFWLRLVHATTRFQLVPAGFPDLARAHAPLIVAMWHGQHFMVSFAWPRGMRVSALISRSGDGELNAKVLERLGVEPVRGAGGPGRKIRKRGGATAFREMLRRLDEGSSVVMTADVPKIARKCGDGIVTLAQKSGRPIYPIAVACKRRIDFNSWDRASIGLPFGLGAMVLGDPIFVASDADADALERARIAVEAGLNDVHARAYGMLGCIDPGAGRVANDGAKA